MSCQLSLISMFYVYYSMILINPLWILLADIAERQLFGNLRVPVIFKEFSLIPIRLTSVVYLGQNSINLITKEHIIEGLVQ